MPLQNVKLNAIQNLMGESSLGASHGDGAVENADCKMSHFAIQYISPSNGGVRWTAPHCVGDGEGPASDPHYTHSLSWYSLSGQSMNEDCGHGDNDYVFYCTVNQCINMYNTHQATKDKMLLRPGFYNVVGIQSLLVDWEIVHEMITDQNGVSYACIAKWSGELPPSMGDTSDTAQFYFRVGDGVNTTASGYMNMLYSNFLMY